MKLTPVVLLFEPVLSSPDSNNQVLYSALEAHGFETTRCSSIPQLTYHVRQHSLTYARPSLTLLAGGAEQNCAAANYLRTVHPDLGIVALSEGQEDKDLIPLLQSGVDNICHQSASGALVAATLFRMLARSGTAIDIPVPPQASTSDRWLLSDQDWVINSPSGRRITLTTGERAFIVTLFNSSELRASHSELIAAINLAYDSEPRSDRRQSRLSVMVSRLRSKFDQYDTELPLKSVHRWGYMFSGQV